jgi:uncharacterized membrane protein YjgN (DUF898 family)
MAEFVKLTCPHCALSRDIPGDAIPPGARQATCPRCRQTFPLQGTEALLSQPDGAPQPQPQTLRFSFNGTARDYFGIWIVNTLLKIVTVGFYTAWAKVRKRCFFYGSTTLHGEPFDYLASPRALFKGWLIASAAFVLYLIGTKVSPALSMAIALIVFIAFPWLLVRSRVFNAVNSSYRNIRFGFRRNYRQAYEVFAWLTILSMLSFGLVLPYMIFRQKKFLVENSSYGSTPFTFSASAKEFYLIAAKVALCFAAAFGLIFLLIGVQGVAAFASPEGSTAMGRLALVPILAFPLVYFLLVVYGQTEMANLAWNSTRLGAHRFRSTLRTRDMALLFVTNALAIIVSLGLLMPWATVRLARYRFEHLELLSVGGLDELLAGDGAAGIGAAGEEISDLFDMPVEIAL